MSGFPLTMNYLALTSNETLDLLNLESLSPFLLWKIFI